jgi:hypothetical protein
MIGVHRERLEKIREMVADLRASAPKAEAA